MSQALRGLFPAIDGQVAYLDNASTTQVFDPSANYCLRANPKRGLYDSAVKATQNLEQARKQVASFLGAKAYQCVFVPSTSYALNLLALALSREVDYAITTHAEHHSNFLPWRKFFKHCQLLSLDADGNVNLRDLQSFSKPRVISLTAGSNVTGHMPNFEMLQSFDPNYDCLVLDATQYLAHKKLNVNDLSVSALAFSSHKLFALAGVGVLWLNDYWLDRLEPPFWGGGMVRESLINPPKALSFPNSWELGSLPVEAIDSLSKSVNWLNQSDHTTTFELYDYLIKRLSQFEFISIYGGKATHNRLPIVSFNIHNMHAHDTAQALAEANICVRAGHHCAAPLMQHFGIDACVRVSLAPYNNIDDINKLLEALQGINKFIN